MGKFTIGVLISVLAVGLAGCSMSKSSSKRMVAVRLRDARGSGQYTHVSSFGSDETPAVIVQEYGGNTLAIKLYDLSTGQQIEERSQYVPYGKEVWWSFPFLQPGSYKAVLEQEGAVRESCIFSVRS